MANARNPKRKGHDTSRDQGGFIALPWAVLDCPAYACLSHPAKALLLEVARQFHKDDNGRMLLSRAYLATRGWKSADTITNAKRELLDGGFIFQTVMGHRPNKASWYAVTWRTLDKLPGYDDGAALLFERGAYRKTAPLKKGLRPPAGTERAAIVPPAGTATLPPVPPAGTIGAVFGVLSVPPAGHPLELPSVAVVEPAQQQAADNESSTALDQTPAPAPAPQPAVEHGDLETVRVKDRDLDPARYDPTTGDCFMRQPEPDRKQRQAADAWVKSVLAAKTTGAAQGGSRGLVSDQVERRATDRMARR